MENKRTLTNDPQYFGAYLNMARHNVFLIINHLTETFNHLGFQPIKSDENITGNINLRLELEYHLLLDIHLSENHHKTHCHCKSINLFIY